MSVATGEYHADSIGQGKIGCQVGRESARVWRKKSGKYLIRKEKFLLGVAGNTVSA